MPYVFLLAAIAAEVCATSLLKSTDGFSRLWPTVFCLTLYAASFAFLSQAVKGVSIGFAYALWSALGTAAIVTIGILFFNESLTTTKIIGVAAIIAGVVILNLGGAH